MTHRTLRREKCACCQNATFARKKNRSGERLTIVTRLRVGKDKPLRVEAGHAHSTFAKIDGLAPIEQVRSPMLGGFELGERRV